MAYKSVNRAVPRIEGAEKVSGNMRYAADLNFPGVLSAKILRTSLPHARVISIDTSKAASLPGVRGIITGADVKGVMVGLRMKDWPWTRSVMPVNRLLPLPQIPMRSPKRL
jgi:CO/xanthine dehydrogenase Mo-binding subunit